MGARLLFTLLLLLPLLVTAGTADDRAHEFFEAYYEEFLPLDPLLASYNGDHRYYDHLTMDTQARRAQLAKLYGRYLAAAGDFDRDELSADSQLYLDAFQFLLARDLEGLQLPLHQLPLVPTWSVPLRLTKMASGEDVHPFNTVADYEAFCARLAEFPAWVDATILNMRAGMEAGVVHPKSIVQGSLVELRPLVQTRDLEASPFWGSIKAFPESIPTAERERITTVYRETLTENVLPAYGKLYKFLSEEYSPKAGNDISLSVLPEGAAMYRYLVSFYTGMNLAPDDIFALGLAEIDRITGEMNRLRESQGYKADLWTFRQGISRDSRNYFKNRGETFEAFRELGETVSERLDRIIGLEYKAPYEIKAVEGWRAANSAGAFYEPASPDGSRAGVFYINFRSAGYPKAFMTTLYLHEALPGHHMQTTLARENERLPRFLRFAVNGAYTEGWGLYSESLGHDLGLYKDPLQLYGWLVYDLGRASRLVADVGIHHKGWSRRQAEQYLRERHLDWAVSEIDRYTAFPGQALGYKIGERMIFILRADAKKALGDDFDLRAFHDAVLESGPLPLPILDRKIQRWVATQN